MDRIPTIGAKFFFLMLASTIVCTIIWQQFVTDHLYNCTDPLWLDFLNPGDWVHGHVVSVPVVVVRSMSEPDTIKQGWTVTGLWVLWFSFVGASVAVSAWVAVLPWRWADEEA